METRLLRKAEIREWISIFLKFPRIVDFILLYGKQAWLRKFNLFCG
jgi:hypothetical protein